MTTITVHGGLLPAEFERLKLLMRMLGHLNETRDWKNTTRQSLCAEIRSDAHGGAALTVRFSDDASAESFSFDGRDESADVERFRQELAVHRNARSVRARARSKAGKQGTTTVPTASSRRP